MWQRESGDKTRMSARYATSTESREHRLPTCPSSKYLRSLTSADPASSKLSGCHCISGISAGDWFELIYLRVDGVWLPISRWMLETQMKLAAFQVHKSWLLPSLLILLLTCLTYGLVGSLAAKPFPWVLLIPGSLPLSMYFFVARPLLKKDKTQNLSVLRRD